MKRPPLTRDTIEHHLASIDRLEPDSLAIFGSLDARGMLRHLRFSFEASIGEPEAEDKSIPFIRALVWVVFFNMFTKLPGGKIKAPPAVTPPAEFEFEEERRLLIEVTRRFVDKLEQAPEEKHINPGFGALTMRQWSKLHGVHNAHHFRQFQLTE